MGRRSINTTKSGKYMNPTDQARKEARKKELKKNKRQRQMVRAAVLKNKDPSQILEEMEKIDEMEYNVLQPSPLNEKVLRDKRKKLKETFDRVMRLYHNDEPEHWAELKRKEVEYEKKRLKKQQYYESVKHAQSVQIDEIPLPAPVSSGNTNAGGASTGNSITSGSNVNNMAFPGGTSSIRVPPPPMTLALPPFAPGAPPGVTKNSEQTASGGDLQADKLKDEEDKDWLGVPPGPPPDLFAMSELDSDAPGNSDYEGDEEQEEAMASSPKLQQRMQNIDDFMKEMEHVHKRKHRKLQGNDADLDGEHKDDKHDSASEGKSPTRQRRRRHRRGSQNNSSSNSSTDDDDEDDDDDDNEEDDDDANEANNDAMGSDGEHSKQPSTNSASKDSMKAAAATATAAALSTVATPTTVPAPPTAPTLPAIPLPPSVPAAPPQQMSQLPPMRGIAPNIMPMFRPPPMRPPGPGMPGFGMRMPPGPPPGARPPHALGPIPRMGIRMPPGPPPGLPPRMAGAHHVKHGSGGGGANPIAGKEQGKGVTTITAKPQIRNLSADVTRFVPSTLRVKREDQRRTARVKHMAGGNDPSERHMHAPQEAHKPPTKDDAYLQFMNEMQKLL